MNFNASIIMQTSSLSNKDVQSTGISCMQIGLDFVFYGVQAALSLSAVAILIHKPDRSRRIMAAVVALWLSSTLEVILDMKSHIVQIQAFSGIPSVSTRGLLLRLSIISEMCFRFNFFVSDAIVVWRAWVLWPQNRMAKSVLLLCITGSLVGLLIASVWWVNSLLGQPLPAAAPFLVTVPLLFTNTVATALVGVRLCLYRRNKNSVGLWRSKTRVERVFFLLVESGSLYCLLWALSLVLDLIHDRIGRLDAYRFIGVTYHSIAGIYPTLIILVVAMQRCAGPRSPSSKDTRCMRTINTIEMQERQTTEDTITVDGPVSSTSKYMVDLSSRSTLRECSVGDADLLMGCQGATA